MPLRKKRMECKIMFCIPNQCDLEQHFSLFNRFRWVACQLDSLASCLTKASVYRALASLPKNLDKTYERILSGITEEHSPFVSRILPWLAFSVRPLYLEEAAEIVAIDVAELPRFDPQKRCFDLRALFGSCASLISIDVPVVNASDDYYNRTRVGHDPKQGYSSTTGLQLRLAHSSVKDYLISERVRNGSAKLYSIDETQSNGTIAEECLAYLLHVDKTESLTTGTLEDYPLAYYAAKNCFVHAKIAENGHSRATALGLEFFQTMTNEMKKWFQLYARSHDRYQLEWLGTHVEIISPLRYASSFGLVHLVKLLLGSGCGVDTDDTYHVDALCAAIVGRYKGVMKLLLDEGAAINGFDETTGFPLRRASAQDSEDILQVLLDRGADINACNEHGDTAILSAAKAGRVHQVQLLLRYNADVNAQGCEGCTALFTAAASGVKRIVQLLLENGADANLRNTEGRSPLFAAAGLAQSRGLIGTGSDDIVRLLIKYGAGLEAQIDLDQTAVSIASEEGYEGFGRFVRM